MVPLNSARIIQVHVPEKSTGVNMLFHLGGVQAVRVMPTMFASTRGTSTITDRRPFVVLRAMYTFASRDLETAFCAPAAGSRVCVRLTDFVGPETRSRGAALSLRVPAVQ